jgi:outer membrane protein assembly factor BamD
MTSGEFWGGGAARCFVLAMALGLLAACNSDEPEIPDTPVDVLYNSALDTLQVGETRKAAKLFDEVERQHPYSTWATQAQLMSAYSYYLVDAYDDAIPALERFIDLHPGNRSAAYAYYLRALCYYEQIADVTRDQGNTELAQRALSDVIARFPNTPYARDATLKLDLVRDHLAGKEMEIGRYYLKRDQFLAAINRFKTVVDQYQTTTHVPEALERLTESYVSLGVFEEAQKSAAVLGYNYPGSEWYLDAYNLLVNRGITTDDLEAPPIVSLPDAVPAAPTQAPPPPDAGLPTTAAPDAATPETPVPDPMAPDPLAPDSPSPDPLQPDADVLDPAAPQPTP